MGLGPLASGRAGSGGTLQWLSFWDEGNYDPEDFIGWANFGFSKDVEKICRGATMGQRHMLKARFFPSLSIGIRLFTRVHGPLVLLECRWDRVSSAAR